MYATYAKDPNAKHIQAYQEQLHGRPNAVAAARLAVRQRAPGNCRGIGTAWCWQQDSLALTAVNHVPAQHRVTSNDPLQIGLPRTPGRYLISVLLYVHILRAYVIWICHDEIMGALCVIHDKLRCSAGKANASMLICLKL